MIIEFTPEGVAAIAGVGCEPMDGNDITTDHEVLTPLGWKPVVAAGDTSDHFDLQGALYSYPRHATYIARKVKARKCGHVLAAEALIKDTIAKFQEGDGDFVLKDQNDERDFVGVLASRIVESPLETHQLSEADFLRWFNLTAERVFGPDVFSKHSLIGGTVERMGEEVARMLGLK